MSRHAQRPLRALAALLLAAALAGGAPAALVRLPAAPAAFGALCLDGSAPALYVREGSPGGPWIVQFDGGGWCYNETNCFERSLTLLGSSLTWPATRLGLGIESADCGANPAFCAWNIALVPYCDGMSLMGSRADPIVYAPNASFSANLLFAEQTFSTQRSTSSRATRASRARRASLSTATVLAPSAPFSTWTALRLRCRWQRTCAALAMPASLSMHRLSRATSTPARC